MNNSSALGVLLLRTRAFPSSSPLLFALVWALASTPSLVWTYLTVSLSLPVIKAALLRPKHTLKKAVCHTRHSKAMLGSTPSKRTT